MKIRWLLAAVSIMVLAAPANTMAQTYPARPIRYVLPFAAGSAVDALARLYAQRIPMEMLKAIISRLNAEVVRITRLPDTRERLSAAGFALVGSSPQEFADYIKANTARIGKVVRDAGIQAE